MGWHELVQFRVPHDRQLEFIHSRAKRKVIRAGRRGGKTVGIGQLAVNYFLDGKRVLYGGPTQDQIDTFWFEVTWALGDAVASGYLRKNETEHSIEVPGTKNRIRAKTAFNADTLRGDYADLLILDEFQLMHEDAWERVGMPMLLDTNGDAVFIYTPPSLHSKYRTKATDPQYASKLYKKAKSGVDPIWESFHFSSHDNPYNSVEAMAILTADMTSSAYQQEIMAEDTDEVPGALWTRSLLDQHRVTSAPELVRIVVGVDPPGGATECGIIVVGIGADGHIYVVADYSLADTPEKWSTAAVGAYYRWEADRVLGEKNYGGDMVEHTIRSAVGGKEVSYRNVIATRGKALRAEPVAALYERGMVHHVGKFPHLENEQCMWLPGVNKSPNRLDALVWGVTDLGVLKRSVGAGVDSGW